MSLLADLLSRVAPGKAESGIPPTLRKVVLESGRKRIVRRKVIVVCGVAAVLVIAGLAIVRFFGHSPDAVRQAAPTRGPISSPQPTGVVTGRQSVEQVTPHQPPKSDPAGFPDQSQPAGRTYVKTSRPQQEAFSPRTAPSRSAAPEYRESRAQAPEAPDQARADRGAEADEALYAAKSSEAAGDHEQALRYYRKAAELSPRNYIVMNKIASVLIAKGSFREGADYARASLAIRGDHLPSLVNLGICAVQTGDNSSGLAYLHKALSLEPSNAYALLNLGLVHEKAKNYDDARNAYSRLAALKDARGYLGMARVSEITGKTDEARRAYRDLLALEDTDGQSKRTATERLQALGD